MLAAIDIGSVPWMYVLPAIFVGLFLLLGVRFIPNSKVGIVEKRWSRKGSLSDGFIALNGEAGYQPDVLRGGIYWKMPFQFVVHKVSLVTITQGTIGYVFARDGEPLKPTQTLGCNMIASNFENAREFLKNGGQRGPQRQILREGTYAINLVQFVVMSDEQIHYLSIEKHDVELFKQMQEVIANRSGFSPIVIKGDDDQIGIITTHDGPSLSNNEIIAPIVGNSPINSETYHNNFQDIEKFLNAGGFRGRQLQVLVDGTYFLNRLFVTVEMVPKTVVEVGYVGVVVSYTGIAGKDISGTEYKHGELVRSGEKGVWNESLLPGKYPFNTSAGKIVMVPTTNFILKWIKSEAGTHRFDENLKEVSLITKDAFEPSLPLSVVVHIDYKKAPLVVQRFGDVKKLVEQTLDPMVSAYFKNIAQTMTIIELLQKRSEIQQISSTQMKEKFDHYNLELEEVLIGTPSSSNAGGSRIEEILAQLRDRQIAEEQLKTYENQEKAATKQRDLNEAQAKASKQSELTNSEVFIRIEENKGKAESARAKFEAEKIRSIAMADSERVARMGIAQAIATEEQVRAYGGPQFQLIQQVMTRFNEAIENSKVDIVPRILIGGQNGQGEGNAMQQLLSMMLADKLSTNEHISREPSNYVVGLRDEMKTAVTKS